MERAIVELEVKLKGAEMNLKSATSEAYAATQRERIQSFKAAIAKLKEPL